jgi:hypothetical protein
MKENQRHNMAYENETRRHNVATETNANQTLQEAIRHNKESESIQWYREKEANRHNLATEFELGRHNKATETETYRHNVVTETETNRHNVRTEDESERHNRASEANDYIRAKAAQKSADASMLSASAAMQNAQTQVRLADQNILESASRIKSNEVSNSLKESQASLVNKQAEWQGIQNYIYGGAAMENAHSYAVFKPSLDAFNDVTGAAGSLVGGFSSGFKSVKQGDSSYVTDIFGNLIN